jgi:chromosome segregation ATPase
VNEADPQQSEERPEYIERLREALDVLWEKSRRVSSIVVRLRDENETLRARMKDIESSSREVFSEREKLIVQLAQLETRAQTAEAELQEHRQRSEQLDESETSVRRSLDETTVLLEQTRRELASMQANGTGPFNKEEKEAVRQKVRELIDKISARL